MDSLTDASAKLQVAVTSHSPDLLDDENLDVDSILAVVADGGVTRVAGIDEAGRSAVRDRLYAAGELLRLNQLTPDPMEIDRLAANQLGLFAENDD